jgi:FkbM family methyltransferase
MYKKYFCTFADSRMEKSLERIKKQAEDMNFFDEISINNENNLDSDFRELFKNKLIKGSRGYGYWVWKPQIILQALKKMDDGDILLYIDAGCHLNKNGVEKLGYYFRQTELSDSGLLVFQEVIKSKNKNLKTSSCLDKEYSKGDIFDYFNVRERKDIYNTGMIAATIIFIKKNKKSQKIIRQWFDTFKNNFRLVDDSPSISPNIEGFIENRHDQSIFSILCKINSTPSISSCEIWQDNWNRLEKYPFWAKRDKKLTLFWLLRQKILSAKSKIFTYMKNIIKKINIKFKKFISATNKEKREYVIRFLKNFYTFILPLIRIFLVPFVSKSEWKNIFSDFKERFTNSGPLIRYRYYLGFKLFYSCSKDGKGIINHITSNRVYEKETCLILEQSIKGISQPSFIDVGANVGLISLYMLNKFPNLKIYAFEPSPHQNILFKMTIDANNISNKIKLFDIAVSDKQGEISFFTHNEANCSGDGLIDTGRGGSGNSIEVKTIPLDIWWNNNNKPNINLIKIDTEGAELLVLKGAKELLTKCSPDIFFEMQESNYKVYNYTWKDIFSFLQSINYSLYSESGDQFIFENAETLLNNNYNFIARKIK